MLFIEASAKTKEGVQCAFEELVEKVKKSIKFFLNYILQIIQTPGLWEKSTNKGIEYNNGTNSYCNC